MSAGTMCSTSLFMTSVSDCVQVVGCWGAPPKIFNMVVVPTPVFVANKMPFWTRAYEGFKHQLVDFSLRYLPVDAQRHMFVSNDGAQFHETASFDVPS